MAASLPEMRGTVSISGQAKYGETLTANVSGVTYSPNTNDDVPTYQWKRDGVAIQGATGLTYTLVQDDIGKAITVTADGVHATGSVTSTATAPVEKADGPAAPAAPELASKTHDSVTLKSSAGHEYRRDGGTWQSSNVFSVLSPKTTYTFTARVEETETHKTSEESAGLVVTTNEEPAPGPESGGDGWSKPGPQTEPTSGPKAEVSTGGGTVASVATSMDTETGTVTTVLTIENLQSFGQDQVNAGSSIRIQVAGTAGAKTYETEMPPGVLMSSAESTIKIVTDIGSAVLPGNMLQDGLAAGAGSVGVSIGLADLSTVPEETRNLIAGRPVIQL